MTSTVDPMLFSVISIRTLMFVCWMSYRRSNILAPRTNERHLTCCVCYLHLHLSRPLCVCVFGTEQPARTKRSPLTSGKGVASHHQLAQPSRSPLCILLLTRPRPARTSGGLHDELSSQQLKDGRAHLGPWAHCRVRRPARIEPSKPQYLMKARGVVFSVQLKRMVLDGPGSGVVGEDEQLDAGRALLDKKKL